MSRHDIRILTTEDGIKVLNQITKKDDFGKNIPDLIKNAKINKKYGPLVYIGWENLNLSQEILIRNAIGELEEHNISYRFSEMNDEVAETNELYYTSEKDGDLPYISIIHTFYDEEMFATLEYYSKDDKNIDEETIDYE